MDTQPTQAHPAREKAFVKWLKGLPPKKQGYALGYLDRIIDESKSNAYNEQPENEDTKTAY